MLRGGYCSSAPGGPGPSSSPGPRQRPQPHLVLLRQQRVLRRQEVLYGLDQVPVTALEHQLQNSPLLEWKDALKDLDVGEPAGSEGCRDGGRVRVRLPCAAPASARSRSAARVRGPRPLGGRWVLATRCAWGARPGGGAGLAAGLDARTRGGRVLVLVVIHVIQVQIAVALRSRLPVQLRCSFCEENSNFISSWKVVFCVRWFFDSPRKAKKRKIFTWFLGCGVRTFFSVCGLVLFLFCNQTRFCLLAKNASSATAKILNTKESTLSSACKFIWSPHVSHVRQLIFFCLALCKSQQKQRFLLKNIRKHGHQGLKNRIDQESDSVLFWDVEWSVHVCSLWVFFFLQWNTIFPFLKKLTPATLPQWSKSGCITAERNKFWFSFASFLISFVCVGLCMVPFVTASSVSFVHVFLEYHSAWFAAQASWISYLFRQCKSIASVSSVCLSRARGTNCSEVTRDNGISLWRFCWFLRLLLVGKPWVPSRLWHQQRSGCEYKPLWMSIPGTVRYFEAEIWYSAPRPFHSRHKHARK